MPLDVAKRGTLDTKDPPLKAIVAANDNYEAGYHKGNPGGLDAIDTDLAPGNIKQGVTIFGKLGTYEPAITINVGIARYRNIDTEGLDWSIKGSAVIPAAAKKVIAANSTQNYTTSSVDVRVRAVYNGAQMYIHTYTACPIRSEAFEAGEFAGTGSAATLTLEHWSQNTSTKCSGAAYYVTVV